MNLSLLKDGFVLPLAQIKTALCLLVLMHFSANGDEMKIQSLTLEDAIKRTVGSHPQLEIFRFKSEALDGETQTAELNPGYTLGVELENILGTGEVSGVKDAEVTLSLSSVIELGDKPQARIAVIDAQRSQLAVEKRVATLDVLGEVNRRYINVLMEQALLALAVKAEELARYTYQAVSKRVDAGASPQLEKMRAESALAKARLDVMLTKKRLEQRKSSLAIMWGDTSPSFEEVDGNLFSFPAATSLASLLNALSASPNLQIYAEKSRVGEARLRLAQANSQYDISWSAGVRRLQGIDETAFVAGVSVPLFQGQRNLGQYNAEKSRLDEIEQARQAQQRELFHQLNQLVFARERASLEVQTLSENIIPPLENALVQVENAYNEGRFSYLEWTATRKELIDRQYALIQAASAIHHRNVDIESLTGLSIQTSLVNAAPNAAYPRNEFE